MKITTIGVDLVKNVLQVHGVDLRGKVVLRKQLKRSQVMSFFAQRPLPGGHGSVWQRPRLGSRPDKVGLHREADGAPVREALREDADAVIEHQSGQACTIEENNFGFDALGIFHRVFGEGRSRDEDALLDSYGTVKLRCSTVGSQLQSN